jgi:hypothetical protein
MNARTVGFWIGEIDTVTKMEHGNPTLVASSLEGVLPHLFK